jgi:toxin-antitoxin system PIN domain toxin
MVVPDVNLLIYAYNSSSVHHTEARRWFEDLLNSGIPVGLPMVSALGFIRIMTDFRIMTRPMSPLKAAENVQNWLAVPGVNILNPGPRHLEILNDLISHLGAAGRLTTDLHIAALAIEVHGEVHSNDRDFERFPRLRLHNPLKQE